MKAVRAIGAAVIITGLVVMAGTAGASDCEMIDLLTAVINTSIGALITASGAFVLLMEEMVKDGINKI